MDTGRVGLVGISIGGMWALRAAAGDPRVKALYDLGGPINTKAFPRLPFLIKTPAQRLVTAMNAVGRDLAVVVGQGVEKKKFKEAGEAAS